MSHARAAIAGALVMLLGLWIMGNRDAAWDARDVVFAVLALLVVVLLLLGIDVRRGRWRYEEPPKDREEDV